jgi:hypothetical protein
MAGEKKSVDSGIAGEDLTSNGGSCCTPRAGIHPHAFNVELSPLLKLLSQQEPGMRRLFAKALNLYVSPGSEAMPEREKTDQLKKAIEESLKSC